MTANVPVSTILANMAVNCERDLPWFVPHPTHGGTAVIAGGAPSLNDTLADVRARKRRGQTVFALNNAWRSLRFAPDWLVMMDARPENAAFLDGLPRETGCLVASMCDPSVFDALASRKVVVWHADHAQGLEAEIIRDAPKPGMLVGGGGTVGLRTINLAYLMGYRRFHLYGLDSCYREGAHHAYPQALNDGEDVQTFRHPEFDGEYRCAPWMARQAQEFHDQFIKMSLRGCSITAHGAGLIPDICRHLNRQLQKKEAA